MGKRTDIEYADSTLNLMMGCLGCELWRPHHGKKPPVRICYAGRLTDGDGRRSGMAGRPGWPESFSLPQVFPDRFGEAERWSNLRGLERADKPWLSGLPRVVFTNDMGDAFTPALPQHWMVPWLKDAASSPHVYLMLTKLPSRMAALSADIGGLPPNVWPGTSITGPASAKRAEALLTVAGGGPKWISYSPALEWVDLSRFLGRDRVAWYVLEGESGGPAAVKLDPVWILRCRRAAAAAGAAFFLKQIGTTLARELRLKSRHGRDMAEWPKTWQVREMPIAPCAPPGQLELLPAEATV